MSDFLVFAGMLSTFHPSSVRQLSAYVNIYELRFCFGGASHGAYNILHFVPAHMSHGEFFYKSVVFSKHVVVSRLTSVELLIAHHLNSSGCFKKR